MRGERIHLLKTAIRWNKADIVISSVHFLGKFIESLQTREPAIRVDLHCFYYVNKIN